jgi:hypothetical protein
MSEEKQNDNKFFNMLERRGIVRKVDDDDNPSGETAEAQTQTATLAESAEGHDTAHEHVPEHDSRAYPDDSYAQDATSEETSSYYQEEGEASSRDALFSWMDKDSEEAAATTDSVADDSTNRYLNIEELYDVLSLKSKKTDTIYLIEDYIKSLPDSLPDESRRQIITKIVAASGFDYDLLMGDGILRVKMLKEYAERFARHTDDYIEARQAEIKVLENELNRIQSLIDSRRELHKKQFLSIEAEAGRLSDILTFING